MQWVSGYMTPFGNYVVALTSLAFNILQNLVSLFLDLGWHNFKTKGDGVLEE